MIALAEKFHRVPTAAKPADSVCLGCGTQLATPELTRTWTVETPRGRWCECGSPVITGAAVAALLANWAPFFNGEIGESK